MSVKILLGWDQAVARWVGDRLGIASFGRFDAISREYSALGITRDGELIAGVVFNNHRDPNIEITMASNGDKRWCNRQVLRVVFAHVFLTAKAKRVTCVVEDKNQPTQAFLCHLGFQQEGILRQGFHSGDAVVYGMLRDECRWLEIGRE